jgi:hypothetical protein
MDPRNVSANPLGGFCDAAPPSCRADAGCGRAPGPRPPALSLPVCSAAAAPGLALRPGREAGRGGRESAGMPRSAGKGPRCLWRKAGVRRLPTVHECSRRAAIVPRARALARGDSSVTGGGAGPAPGCSSRRSGPTSASSRSTSPRLTRRAPPSRATIGLLAQSRPPTMWSAWASSPAPCRRAPYPTLCPRRARAAQRRRRRILAAAPARQCPLPRCAFLPPSRPPMVAAVLVLGAAGMPCTLPSSAKLRVMTRQPSRGAARAGAPARNSRPVRDRGGCGAQAGASVALGGRVWANRTLFSQAYQPRHQSLLNGQTYYVTVQATSRTASRLTANATSAGVKARPRPAPPSRGACWTAPARKARWPPAAAPRAPPPAPPRAGRPARAPLTLGRRDHGGIHLILPHACRSWSARRT